jgi:hypothetical protein
MRGMAASFVSAKRLILSALLISLLKHSNESLLLDTPARQAFRFGNPGRLACRRLRSPEATMGTPGRLDSMHAERGKRGCSKEGGSDARQGTAGGEVALGI